MEPYQLCERLKGVRNADIGGERTKARSAIANMEQVKSLDLVELVQVVKAAQKQKLAGPDGIWPAFLKVPASCTDVLCFHPIMNRVVPHRPSSLSSSSSIQPGSAERQVPPSMHGNWRV